MMAADPRNQDFGYFLDSILDAVARQQPSGEIEPKLIAHICNEIWADAPYSFVQAAGRELASRGYGLVLDDDTDPEIEWFEINGAGLARVAAVRSERKPPTFTDTLASDKVQKIGTLAISGCSFLVSLLALWIAFLAFVRP